ncbi:amidophosphoribosyltransferase [Opitutaceae bacterium EW11]|nr:amidophosphoribosyltransferase [Opitutaceae bacterium EW11]
MKPRVAAALGAVADVVFPRSCVACGGMADAAPYRHLCSRCVAQIDFIHPPCCETCGAPFYGFVDGERCCPHCEGLSPAYRSGRAAVLSKGPIRALIHELKYRRHLFVLEDVEVIFRACPRILEFVADATLVPVPLHPRKQRERGYNQSELLAETLARAASGKPQVQNLLRRSVDTTTQTAFDRKARLANLKNAFALAEKAVITPGHHYVLVDDVFTTGSTLNSCARVLRHAGCLNLDVVTFGHG